MAHLRIDLWDEQARDRIEALFWLLAQELLQLGQSVILESGFWSRAGRDEKRLGARAIGAAVELRYLPAAMDELVRRLAARNAEGAWGSVPLNRADLEDYVSHFQAPDDDQMALFDPIINSATSN